MKDSTVPYRQAVIRIVYGMNEDGEQIIATAYEADGEDEAVPDFFTGLCMFEVAKLDFLRRHGVITSEPS
jgi:hypothetical protein